MSRIYIALYSLRSKTQRGLQQLMGDFHTTHMEIIRRTYVKLYIFFRHFFFQNKEEDLLSKDAEVGVQHFFHGRLCIGDHLFWTFGLEEVFG